MMTLELTTQRQILFLDESTSGNIVTAGGLLVRRKNINFVLSAMARVKQLYNIETNAEIHCRSLFAGDSRRKSPFRHLPPSAVVPFIARVIAETTVAGAYWVGTWCDYSKYPRRLAIAEDGALKWFEVTPKHMCALLLCTQHMMIEKEITSDFNFIFDRDSTKIDWGMSKRMQVSSFVSLSARSIPCIAELQPFLELADVAAYVLGRAISAQSEPENRKLQRFELLHRNMNMRVARFQYLSPENSSPLLYEPR